MKKVVTGDDDACVYIPSTPCSVAVGPCAAQLVNPTNWGCKMAELISQLVFY
ncbi:MAG: hypothetical protein QNK75_02310 [Crocinitomicaceae bacterium]